MDRLHYSFVEGTEAATKATASRRVLKIVSKCSSEAEFLAVFHRFCDHESLFVVTKTPKPVGSTSRLAITLADGKPMLVGEGRVIESSNDTQNELGRPGMRIRFTELDGESRETLAKLNATRAAAAATSGTRGPAKPAAKNGRQTIMAPAVPPPTAAGTPPPALPGAPMKIPAIPKIPQIAAARPVTERAPTRGGKERLASPRVLTRSPAAETSERAVPPLPTKPSNGVPLATVPLAKSEPTTQVNAAPATNGSQADDDAPTNVSPSSGRAPSEMTAVDNPRGEVRAEGSDFILPANPFGELTDESLEAFVECTLYEETGTISIEPETGPPETDGESLPPWWPKGGDGTHTPLPPAAPGMFSPGMDNTGEVPLGRAPTPPPVGYGPAHAPAMIAGYGAMQGEPTAAGVLAPAFMPARQRPAWLPIVATAAATAVITLLLGYALWGRGGDGVQKERVVAAPATSAAPVEAAVEAAVEKPAAEPEEKASVVAAVGESESEGESEGEGEGESESESGGEDDGGGDEMAAVDAGDGECRVSITTEPDGARVYADGRSLPGKTPLVAAVPCEAKVVDIKRARYEDVRRPVAPREGALTEVAVRLQRPKVQLRLVSYPSGATVSIGGRRVGTAPLTATVDGFLYTSVSFEKSGYKKSSQRIYPKKKLTLVKGRLESAHTARTR